MTKTLKSLFNLFDILESLMEYIGDMIEVNIMNVGVYQHTHFYDMS